jgi:peptide/nickel transport system substrate-binding protein
MPVAAPPSRRAAPPAASRRTTRRPRGAPFAALAGLATLLAAACGDAPEGGTTGGTLVVATVGDPGPLLPPVVATLQGVQIVDQLFDRLAEPTESLTVVGDRGFRPRLARSWQWAPDSLSIRFALDPRARWHDGRSVTAGDVRFSHALYRDPAVDASAAPLLRDVDSVSVPDSLTAVVWFRRRSPQQFFDVTYQLYVLPQHLLDTVPRGALAGSAMARAPIGSGRFRFVARTPEQSVTLEADTTNWRGRPALDRAIWSVSADPQAATMRLLTGEADLWEQVRPDGAAEVARAPELRLQPLPSLDVGYLAFNLRAPGGAGPHPVLGDPRVRRAIAAAVDRPAAVRNVFDTLAYVSSAPLPRALMGWRPGDYGPAPDAARARAELEAAGWRDADGDGIRERGGRPLAFGVLVPTTSSARQRLAVVLQAQLRAVGVRLDVNAVDRARFEALTRSGRFDAMMQVWHHDPSPAAVLQLWGASDGRGSANLTGYTGPAVEATIDSAGAEGDPTRAAALYRRAFERLADDAPAVWLYEVRNFAGIHRRVRPTGARADAWWAGLADWTIDPDARIARDRIGLARATR